VVEHLHGPDPAPGPARLEHDADARQEVGPLALGVEAEHAHGAALRPAISLAGLQGGGLAGSVRAQHGSHGSALHDEGQPVDRDLVAVGHHQPVDLDGGGGWWHLPSLGSGPERGVGHPDKAFDHCRTPG